MSILSTQRRAAGGYLNRIKLMLALMMVAAMGQSVAAGVFDQGPSVAPQPQRFARPDLQAVITSPLSQVAAAPTLSRLHEIGPAPSPAPTASDPLGILQDGQTLFIRVPHPFELASTWHQSLVIEQQRDQRDKALSNAQSIDVAKTLEQPASVVLLAMGTWLVGFPRRSRVGHG